MHSQEATEHEGQSCCNYFSFKKHILISIKGIWDLRNQHYKNILFHNQRLFLHFVCSYGSRASVYVYIKHQNERKNFWDLWHGCWCQMGCEYFINWWSPGNLADNSLFSLYRIVQKTKNIVQTLLMRESRGKWSNDWSWQEVYSHYNKYF